jgi:hypothetical protein
MKMRSMLVAAAAGVVLLPAGPVLAQDLPDVPGIDPARDQISQAPRGAAANPTRNLPGGDLLPKELSRPARGSGSPTRLPETGVDTTALALDAVTLLGAGTLLLTIRRRLATQR